MDDRTQDLARFLVREHDAAVAAVARTKAMPRMNAYAEGKRDGIDSALAYLAGQNGHRSTSPFIHAVRADMPHPQLVTESELRALDGDR